MDATDAKLPGRLGVVIANWNGREHLITCLTSLRSCEPSAYATVVVDNGSNDGSAEAVATRFDEVILIRNKENLGFASALNAGARAAVDRGCDYVLILNNDTVVASNALGLLLRAIQAPGVELVNPLITDISGGIWFSGSTFNRWTGAVKHTVRPVDPSAGLQPLPSATGCAIVMRAALVRDFGPFDERYFIYYEDSDISATVRERGGRIVLEPAAVVEHRVSADTRRNTTTAFFYYLFTRNRMLFAKRHVPTPWPLFLARFTAGYMLPRLTALVILGRFKEARAFIRGYTDYFRGHFGPPRLN